MSTDDDPGIAIARLHSERDTAKGVVVRGVTLVLLIPIVLVVALAFSAMADSLGPLLVASLYTLIGGAVGVTSLGAGLVRLRSASKQLREIEAARLPQARLLT